jgi:hypothetical protein
VGPLLVVDVEREPERLPVIVEQRLHGLEIVRQRVLRVARLPGQDLRQIRRRANAGKVRDRPRDDRDQILHSGAVDHGLCVRAADRRPKIDRFLQHALVRWDGDSQHPGIGRVAGEQPEAPHVAQKHDARLRQVPPYLVLLLN